MYIMYIHIFICLYIGIRMFFVSTSVHANALTVSKAEFCAKQTSLYIRIYMYVCTQKYNKMYIMYMHIYVCI